MKKVMFVFDKVAHYHEPLFVALNSELPKHGYELHLMSGNVNSQNGRAGLTKKVVQNEYKYDYKEINVSSYTLKLQKNVIGIIKSVGPDVVVVPSHIGNLTTWRIGKLKKKMGFKLYSWQCGYEYNPGKYKDKIINKFMQLFDFQLAYHTNAQKYIIAHSYPLERTRVIYNTINEKNIKLVSRNDAKNLIYAKYPVIKNKKIILYVGAILKEKKLQLLINSFLRLAKEDAALMIVGNGEQLDELRTQCADKQNIIFPGKVVEEVGVYFDAADIFVLPGTGGLALNEAMAHGLPIISGYADGSADDLVINGKNGFRLKEYTEGELEKYLLELLGDEDKRACYGKAGQQMINNELSFQNFIFRVVESIKKS